MPTALTLRVSEIPAGITENQFIDLLETFINKNSPVESKEYEKNIVLWSFAPSAVSVDRNRWSVATVSFERTPRVLPRSGSITLTGNGQSFKVFLDSTFLGLTPLNNPKVEAVVDIIAVTGLAGHAFGSWKSRSQSTMWLRDFLPEYVPEARILTYGYDSALVGGGSNASIIDFSTRFLEELKFVRAQENEKERPIIFLGHSLGGLVIKQALVKAARGSERDKQILLSCYGLMFFGVPNRGLRIDELSSMVKNQPSSNLVKDLDPASPTLLLLHEGFCNYFDYEDSPIVSIFETKKTKTVVLKEDIWKREGPMHLMVSKDSATYSGPTERRYDQLPIDADHSEITKFSHRLDSDFHIVRQRLINFVKKAPEVISKRFSAIRQNFSSSQTDDTTQLYQKMKEILNPVNFDADTTYRSLQICEGTGNWLLSDNEFLRWREMLSPRVLWLRGGPGSGKTYLMSRVLENIKSHYGADATIAYFFCDNKTETTERRAIPFIVKTLVFQLLSGILRYHPDDVDICLQQFEMLTDNKMIPWLLKNTLERIGRHLHKAFIILDALDECDEIDNLLELLRCIGNIKNITLQIIVASRESIGSHLLRDLSVHEIPIYEGAKHDVETFILSQVQKLDIRDLGSEEEAARRLVDGCGSLFLLAKLRIDLLRGEMHTHGDLNTALLDLPVGLKEVYRRILGKVDVTDEARALTKKIFMWIIYAKRQLTFVELAKAVSLGDTEFSGSVLTHQGLEKLCGGLVLLKPQDSSVELVHITVKEYVVDSFIWETIPPSPCLNNTDACNSEILLRSIAYMCNLNDEQLDPLLDYVYKSWILHLFSSNKPTPLLLERLTQFLSSESCFSWWNSPLSSTLNGTAKGREYLQSRFLAWIKANITLASERQRHRNFIIAQQKKQVAWYIKEKGKNHRETLKMTANLAETYWSQARWGKARKLEMRVWAASVKHLGDVDPDTLSVARNLGRTYQSQARWKDVEKLQKHMMNICVSKLGEDHPESLAAAQRLGEIYKVSNLKAAEKLQKRVATTLERNLGENHRDTLAAKGDLGRTYMRQRRLEEAIELQEHVIETSRRILGDNDPLSIVAMTRLVAAYCLKNRIEEAIDLQERIAAGLEASIGKDHPDSLTALSDLALAYVLGGRAEEAENLIEHVFTVREKALGKRHPLTLFSAAILAIAHLCRGRILLGVGTLLVAVLRVIRDLFKYGITPAVVLRGYFSMMRTIDVGKLKIPYMDVCSVRIIEFEGFTIFGENIFDAIACEHHAQMREFICVMKEIFKEYMYIYI